MRAIMPINTIGVGMMLVGFLLSTELQAITITFGGADRQPSDPLQIGGDITVSSYGGGVPATELGKGLGSALVGPIGSVDRIMHFAAGSLVPDSDTMEGLHLDVDGTINSFTIVPYFSILGGGGSVTLPFEILYYGYEPGGPNFELVDPSGSNPLTFGFSPNYPYRISHLDIAPAADMEQPFSSYRRDHLLEETYQFGFTITSLDYTPNVVPDSGVSIGLFGLALAGLWGIKRLQSGRSVMLKI